MELLARLQDDMKVAMKAGEKARLQVIRMLISEVKNIDLQPTKPTAQQAVESYAKKLRKAQEEYAKLGKADEARQLGEELAVVEGYLPAKASAAETGALVDAFLAANPFTEKQVGQAMGAFMKAHGPAAGGPQIDPAVANPLIRQKLAGK